MQMKTRYVHKKYDAIAALYNNACVVFIENVQNKNIRHLVNVPNIVAFNKNSDNEPHLYHSSHKLLNSCSLASFVLSAYCILNSYIISFNLQALTACHSSGYGPSMMTNPRLMLLSSLTTHHCPLIFIAFIVLLLSLLLLAYKSALLDCHLCHTLQSLSSHLQETICLHSCSSSHQQES